MTPEDKTALRALLRAANRKHADAGLALDDLTVWADRTSAEEPVPAPPEITPRRGGNTLPRALVEVGTSKTRAGQNGVIAVTVTCPEPVAGLWLNLRHSPRLTAKSGDTPLSARAFKFEKGEDHSRTLIMFSSDLETASAGPGGGLIQLEPGAVVLRVTYAVDPETPPGRYPVDGGWSGIAGGGRRTSWPSLLLNWGRGGIEPQIEGGYVEVVG